VHRAIALVGGRLHRKQRDDLEQVVLDDVAQATCGFVEATALADAEVFGQRHLHAGHVGPVPDRLGKGIGEPEIQDVHDRFLAQVMIDAKDRRLGKHLVRDLIEFDCGGQVAAEGLFHDQAGIVGDAGAAEALDHRREERRRNRQVVSRAL
jgi:hypothetical protein